MGLVQREIEAAGIFTVSLTNIPDLTQAAGGPRIVGIERPFGRNVGDPDDEDGQRSVLNTTLTAAAEMKAPGSVFHLPLKWKSSRSAEKAPPMDAPPITNYLTTHPWLIPRLLNRKPPAISKP